MSFDARFISGIHHDSDGGLKASEGETDGGLTRQAKEMTQKKEEAGQVVPPPQLPFRGSPASLTEGG